MIKEVELTHVCDVIAGQSPPSSTYNQEEDGIPFFQGKADFGELYPTVRYWCNEPKKLSEPNDILFSLRAPVGPTNLNNIQACIGRGLAAIRCKDIERMYLLHFLRGNEEKIALQGTGSTFKAITIGTLKALKIPLPPLPEQKKIAAILDAADAYRQKTKALLTKYDELTQSLFLEMFGDPVRNPKGWEFSTIEKVCLKIMGGGTPSKTKPEFYDGIIPWVTPKDMKSEYIMDSIDHINELAIENSSAKLIPSGSVLMVIRSGILKHTLPVGINKVHVAVNQDMKAFIVNQSITNSIFLKSFFNAASNFLLAKVRAVTADNIEFKQIKELEFPIPPISLQNQFASRIQAIEKQKAQAQQSLEKAEELFQSLLQRAFSGSAF